MIIKIKLVILLVFLGCAHYGSAYLIKKLQLEELSNAAHKKTLILATAFLCAYLASCLGIVYLLMEIIKK